MTSLVSLSKPSWRFASCSFSAARPSQPLRKFRATPSQPLSKTLTTRSADADLSTLVQGAYTHLISTLDPNRLSREDWLDLHTVPPTLALRYRAFPARDAPFRSSRSTPTEEAELWRACYIRHKALPSPLRGFFYYHSSRRAPPLSGDIRFRLTRSRDPSSFASGHDLPSFSIPIFSIARNATHLFLRRLLIRDGLVSPDTLNLARSASKMGQVKSGGLTSRPVHAFGQPFPFNLGLADHNFLLISDDTVIPYIIRVQRLTVVPGADPHVRSMHWPFAGSPECCFEPYVLPDHPGKRFVAIRVLRESPSDPIRCVPHAEYGGPPYPPELVPRVGELLHFMYRGEVRKWLANVDGVRSREAARTRHARELGVLFENEEKYGRYDETLDASGTE